MPPADFEGKAMPARTTIFVSYCRRNKRWLDRLKVHLEPYDRRGDLDLWDDSKIDPGDRWHAAISDAIDRAAASVVLISADFLASDLRFAKRVYSYDFVRRQTLTR
jgi:TIR domain